MSDYNWKSCSNPANAERLRELLKAGRCVIVETAKPCIYFTVWADFWLDRLIDDGSEHWRFLDPDEPAQMRARIEELEAEVKLLTQYIELDREHLPQPSIFC
jgi:hypothetical protein